MGNYRNSSRIINIRIWCSQFSFFNISLKKHDIYLIILKKTHIKNINIKTIPLFSSLTFFFTNIFRNIQQLLLKLFLNIITKLNINIHTFNSYWYLVDIDLFYSLSFIDYFYIFVSFYFNSLLILFSYYNYVVILDTVLDS